MVSAIFQPQINTLQNEVAAMQATIAAAHERISELECCALHDGWGGQIAEICLEKISGLAPDAIADTWLRFNIVGLYFFRFWSKFPVAISPSILRAKGSAALARLSLLSGNLALIGTPICTHFRAAY